MVSHGGTWNVGHSGGPAAGGVRQVAVVLYAWSMVCVCVPSMLPASAAAQSVGRRASAGHAKTLQAHGRTSQQDVGGAAGVQVVLHVTTQSASG